MSEVQAGRYVLSPGYVISKSDGDRHYIGTAQLRRLYGVPNTARCISDEAPDYRPMQGDILLCPRHDGNYQRAGL
jgi:hypothetical protein